MVAVFMLGRLTEADLRLAYGNIERSRNILPVCLIGGVERERFGGFGGIETGNSQSGIADIDRCLRSVSSGNDKARVRVFQGFAQEIDVFFRRLESGDNVDDQLRTLSFIGHGQRLLSEFVLIVTRNFNAVRIQRNSFSVNHQRALIQIQIAAENVNRLRS